MQLNRRGGGTCHVTFVSRHIFFQPPLHLSLLAFKDSNPISPLTVSLHVLEEQPSIFLAE